MTVYLVVIVISPRESRKYVRKKRPVCVCVCVPGLDCPSEEFTILTGRSLRLRRVGKGLAALIHTSIVQTNAKQGTVHLISYVGLIHCLILYTSQRLVKPIQPHSPISHPNLINQKNIITIVAHGILIGMVYEKWPLPRRILFLSFFVFFFFFPLLVLDMFIKKVIKVK